MGLRGANAPFSFGEVIEMSKQDRQGARTTVDLERRYNLGGIDKRFSEVLGISDDMRESVDLIVSVLRSEFEEQVTSLTRDTERIILSALESKVETSDYEQLQQTVQSELSVMAERISLSFDTATSRVTEVDGQLQTVIDELSKHFDFTADGLTIRAGENAMNLKLDNDVIRFEKNGQEFGWWDGVDFHTGNIVVSLNERAQFGNFAFVPRSNGSLDFLKVGG